MGGFFKRLLSGAAALCLTAGLTGCVSRLPQGDTNSDAASSASSAAAPPESTGTTAMPNDKDFLYRLVRKAAQNTPGAMALNAEVDVQLSMRGDWGRLGYRYKGPVMTDSREGKNRLYYEREYTYWSSPESEYHYDPPLSLSYMLYYDGEWLYENTNGHKTKEKGEYAGILTDWTRKAAPLLFSSRCVLSAEAESAKGTSLVRFQLDPENISDSLFFLHTDYGDDGEWAEILSLELEFVVKPDGCLQSQKMTVSTRSRETFGDPEDLDPQEEVEYTEIFATTFAPKEQEAVIVPPDDLDTYRIGDKDEV